MRVEDASENMRKRLKEAEENTQEKDLLPLTLYGRTMRNGDNTFDLIYSPKPFRHGFGQEFFVHGVYSLQELYVCGSNFVLSFSPKLQEKARDESGFYKGRKEKIYMR